MKVRGASGILFDLKPMFCGGQPSYSGYSCQCFTYEQSQWVSDSSMSTCRYFQGSAGLQNQEDRKSRFVIAGGRTLTTSEISNVESYDGASWKNLPDLPTPVEGHCMVAINETVLLSIGGIDMVGLHTETSFYNAELNQWLPGPESLEARSYSSCAMVHWKNPAHGQLTQVVVVAGGYVTQTSLLQLNFSTSMTSLQAGSLDLKCLQDFRIISWLDTRIVLS